MSELSNSKTEEEEEEKPSKRKEKQEFKKPSDLLVLNKKPKKSSHSEHKSKHHGPSPAEHISHHSIPLPYKEPEWSAISEGDYNFDVLKSGKIIDNLVVKSKAFYTFGRQGNCDFPMLNPTISRYHAIFQFRKDPSTDQPAGFYLYDLGSTHGTFLNKKKIPPNTYIRIRVGHMLKLGLSTRYFILNGPEEDMDIEYDNIRRLREDLEDDDEIEYKVEMEVSKKKDDEGIDWGMRDDADEETDLSENPYAATNNEELYLNDPKKTLRNWFEREGCELEFNIEEKGPGHFACSIELPIDVNGIKKAQTIVKGKKNHAKVQCALEACKLLDRYGLLRVANHASSKAKPKKWEDDDFYDSDEDAFLDRTGTIEKKRHQRMKAAGKLEEKVETYSSLVEKHKKIVEETEKLENELASLTHSKSQSKEEEKDELDAFMDDLHYSVADKTTIKKINDRLLELKKEKKMCQHMMTLSKPVELPSLNPNEKVLNKGSSKMKSKTPLFGPRKNLHRKKKEHKLNKEEKEKTEYNVIHEDNKSENNTDSLDNLNLDKGKNENKINKDSAQEEKEKKEIEEAIEEESEKKEIEQKKKEINDGGEIEEKKKETSDADEKKETSDDEEKKETSDDEEKKKNSDDEEKKEISDDEEKKEISDDEEKREISEDEEKKETSEEEEEIMEIGSNANEINKSVNDNPSTSETKTHQDDDSNSDQNESSDKEMTNNDDIEMINAVPIKSKERKRKSSSSHKEKNKISKYEDPPEYTGWLPPSDQTGDGKTSLNDKYGY